MAGRARRDREFVDALAEGQSIRYRFNLSRGRVTAFTIQLEADDASDGRWRPVVRYDDAHGAPHRDVLDWDGRVVEKTWPPAGMTNEQAMHQGIRDLKGHHDAWLDAFGRTGS